MGVQTLALGKVRNAGRNGFQRVPGVVDEAGLLDEIVHAQRAGKACGAAGGQGVVGARKVIAQRLRHVAAQEDAARIADLVQHAEGILHAHFKVLRCNDVAGFNGLVQVGADDDLAVVVHAGPGNGGAGQLGDLHFQFRLHGLGQLCAVGNEHRACQLVVLDTYGVGDAISTHHPALRGFYDQVIMDLTEENVRETAKKSDVIMIQVPSGDVAKWAEIVLAEDCAIIDIGADIRFRDVDVWEKWYGQKHPDAKMTHDAVYCIPEVMRDLAKGKKLIANPGCYPTASTLGLQPMLKAGHIVDNTIVIDAKSGYTGAGRRPALNKLLTEAENNFCAYALGGGHRHTPEIEQNIAYITGKDLMKPETWQYINFQPHLLPQVRGIEVTIYATCDKDFTNEEVYELYKDFYKDEPFVKVFPASLPVQTKWVYGTNFCEMTPTFDARTHRLIVSSVIDNIGKGAAGQAIQNMNLIMGLPETTGLMMPPMYP